MSHSKLLSMFLFFLITTFASSLNTKIHKCPKNQSEALLLFKQSLSSDNSIPYACPPPLLDSNNYPIPMIWNASTDCCNWDGVTCDYSTGDVIGLDVSCKMLKGTIHRNSSLFNLPHLQKLNLAFNNFTGSEIPQEIGRFSNSLTHLNLSLNGFSGQVPITNITLLHKLVSLDLSRNYDLKFAPHVFLNMFRMFTYLEELSLEYVNISMVLPTTFNLSSSLKLLNLGSTGLKGKIPHYIFNLYSLETLDLGNNRLVGHIDMQPFQKLTNLTFLSLSSNNFSGEWELDTLFTSLTNLEYLDLSHNNFYVTTKNTDHYVNPGFRKLYLASCKLRVFPNSFRAMKQLEELDLSSNEIHGQIPHWAGEIGGTYGLYHLNLSHNFITGLPRFQWYGLQYLDLQYNLIYGRFPPSICNMSDLWYLDMSNNRFHGPIPQCFGNITSSLMMIDMGRNSFRGTIPSFSDSCEWLVGLVLQGNQLEGEVPRSLSKCQSLKVVDFGNNHLNGTFPEWLGDLPNLHVLVLKSNNFHGHIQLSSTAKFSFSRLQVLDLSHNGFVGQLPAKYFQSFNSMKNVVKKSTKPEYLSMVGKYYSFVVAVKGVNQNFPKVLVDYTIINLSNNSFEGHIPNVIGGLNSLKVLNLSHNSLIGQIPHAMGNLIEIESLDLSWNQLSGEIPQSLVGIKGLAVLNVSQNHLVGRIPKGTQFNTFNERSFAGNLGLCGFPLPKKCDEYTQKPQLEAERDHEDESGLTWEVVILGYGCGTLLGLVMGYIMLSTRKVKWFNVIADAAEDMFVHRNNRRHV